MCARSAQKNGYCLGLTHGFSPVALAKSGQTKMGEPVGKESDKREERITISRSLDRRPYGAEVKIIVRDGIVLEVTNAATMLVSRPAVVSIQDNDAYYHPNSGTGIHWRFSIEGFRDASTAERVAEQFTIGLLWAAAKLRFPMRLDYSTPLPFFVYDRKVPSPPPPGGWGTVGQSYPLKQIVDAIEEVFSTERAPDHGLLLALELFNSARLEITARSRFVNLVSSLEPLAQSQDYPADFCVAVDRAAEALAQKAPSTEQDSIRGRILELKQESISRAILRMVRELLPTETQAPDLIREAYSARSQLLHRGQLDDNLGVLIDDTEAIIRKLLAARLGLSLTS